MNSRLTGAIVAIALLAAACTSGSDKAASHKAASQKAASQKARPDATTTTANPTTTAKVPARAATSTTAVASAPTTSSAPLPPCNRPHASGLTRESFTFANQTRTYRLYVPPAYTGAARVPVVFNFHGYGSNAIQQMLYANFTPLADRHDFVIVAPDGQDSPSGRHFNLTNEAGLQNDVVMVGSLLDHIEATLCIDPLRVYSTGMSDGGAMTSALACLLTDKFAAFAAVAVIYWTSGCAGTHPVAIAAFQGTADPVVPFGGGPVHCCGGTMLPSAPAATAGWAAHDHCAKAFTDTRLSSEVRRRTWSDCDPASAVVFYIIDGGGHTWPGSIPLPRFGMTTQQIKATDVIWQFFSSRKLVN